MQMGRFLVCFYALFLSAPLAHAQSDVPAKHGLVVDNGAAEFVGNWKTSTHVKPFYGVNYVHDDAKKDELKTATFRLKVAEAGKYQLLVSYTTGGSRARKVPVSITAADGAKTVHVDQLARPKFKNGFHPLGEFALNAGEVKVTISNKGTTPGKHVIVDAVWLVKQPEFPEVVKLLKKPVTKTIAAKPPVEAKRPEPHPPEFERKTPGRKVATLTSAELDRLLLGDVNAKSRTPLVDDERFLRRVTLDLFGRPPTPEEQTAFANVTTPDKRSKLVDGMLTSPEFGRNWAIYWSDVMRYRQQEPELTFHNYKPFKAWLADEINSGSGWDQSVFEMLTAKGKVGDKPQSTFVAFHQGDPRKLAGETSRVFLSIKIACAECHDHPFVEMPQEVFHGMAAFFTRTQVKIAQFDSNLIAINSNDKGEHKIDGKKGFMKPTVLEGSALELGMADLQRRGVLAEWLVSGDNPWFAKSYVNRVWARLMGRGFFDPVDDMGDEAESILSTVHERLSDHVIASEFDHKAFFRLVLNSHAYQQEVRESVTEPFLASAPKKLRGDEVFDSLATTLSLEDFTPERQKKTAAVRFPPPPKSTRDLVDDAFGYDPSFPDDLIIRTMRQAMFLMNNEQLQKQINAAPENGTMLAKILQSESDNEQVILKLYQVVLARKPSARETELLLTHIKNVNNRASAFEDILWSLINSAEFTTRN